VEILEKLMERYKHYRTLAVGWLLFHTMRHLPTKLWMPGGVCEWVLPFKGYYAYQPARKE